MYLPPYVPSRIIARPTTTESSSAEVREQAIVDSDGHPREGPPPVSIIPLDNRYYVKLPANWHVLRYPADRSRRQPRRMRIDSDYGGGISHSAERNLAPPPRP
jgi:hypothetical protein